MVKVTKQEIEVPIIDHFIDFVPNMEKYKVVQTFPN